MAMTLPARGLTALLAALLTVLPASAQQPGVPPFDRTAAPGEPPPVPERDRTAPAQPKVLARGPVDPARGLSKTAWELRGENKTVVSTFASTFALRPLLKCIAFASAIIVLGVLVNYGLLGLSAITAKTRSDSNSAGREK